MKFLKHETGRFYDTEQVLTILIRDNETWDDQFLKHDIVFWDKSRKIVGCINFETSEDRKDFFEIYKRDETKCNYVMRKYDAGDHMIGGHVEIDQIMYYYARYS